MKTDKNFVNKWMILTVSLSVLAICVCGYAIAQEDAFSEALYANPPPLHLEGSTAASPDAPDYSTRGNLVGTAGDAKDPDPRHLMPEGYQFEPTETGPMEMIGPQLFYRQAFVEPIEPVPYKSGVQPLLGVGWDHDAGGYRKWNIAFGFGFYFTDYHDWRYPAEDYGLEEPPSADRPSDLFDKIRGVLEIVGFKIRYDF